MDDIIYYAFALVSLVAGALLGVFIQRHVTSKRIGEANELAQRIVEEARKEAQAQKKEILLQGQNEIFSQKHAFEAECKDQERALKNREKKLQDISDRMEEKMERITQKEHDILAQEKEQTQRERVLAVMEQHNYSPSWCARGLRLGKVVGPLRAVPIAELSGVACGIGIPAGLCVRHRAHPLLKTSFLRL